MFDSSKYRLHRDVAMALRCKELDSTTSGPAMRSTGLLRTVCVRTGGIAGLVLGVLEHSADAGRSWSPLPSEDVQGGSMWPLQPNMTCHRTILRSRNLVRFTVKVINLKRAGRVEADFFTDELVTLKLSAPTQRRRGF